MQREEWSLGPVSGLSAVYRLDEPDLMGRPAEDPARDGTDVSAAAAIWAVARGVAGAGAMILLEDGRIRVAAGTLLVEGRTGLNVGLLLPALRAEPAGPEARTDWQPELRPVWQRVIWALADRVARIEAPRVLLLDLGEVVPIHAARGRFALPDGMTVEALRADLAQAVAAGRSVRFSLGDGAKDGPFAADPVSRLVAEPDGGVDIRLGQEGWPLVVPAGLDLAALAQAMVLAERMTAAGCGPGAKLQVLGATARPVVTVTRAAEGWTISGFPSGGVV